MANDSLAHIECSGIYEIVNTVNGKRYIGSAVNFKLRWKLHLLHLKRGTHHSSHLQAAWNLYGAEKFLFRRILLCDKADLIMYEQIAFYALIPEYNIAKVAGSCLGIKHSEETRAKISASKIGNKHTLGYRHRPESIEKLRAKQIGVPSPTKGKMRSAEAVAATAAAHTGMKRSVETRAKISEKAKGRIVPPRSEEYLAKMSAAHKGKKKSPEHMAAFQAGRAKRGYSEQDRLKISERMREAYQSGKISREKSVEHRMRIAQSGSRLTAEQIYEIRRLSAGGETGRSLALRFGVPPSSITHILKGRTYKWVPPEN